MFAGEGNEVPPDAPPPAPATPRAAVSRFLVPKPGDPVYNADSIGRINTRMRGSNGALIAPMRGRDSRLRGVIREAAMRYPRAVGIAGEVRIHYGYGEIIERPVIVFGYPRHDRGRLRALVEMWAREFGQDRALWMQYDNPDALLIDVRVGNEFGPSVIENVGPFDAARTAEYYAMLRSDAPKTPVTGIMYLQQKSFFSRGDKLV